MDLNEGILSLKVVEGKLFRDTEMMGKMSPYLHSCLQRKQVEDQGAQLRRKTAKVGP